ncbi:MAG: hypothetical protein EHM36_11115 [Deltaproteobacteria bacterium]|nr:MAG: hypothetical protein EHM36_11115 [Deltaproteobacteria bacterium]
MTLKKFGLTILDVTDKEMGPPPGSNRSMVRRRTQCLHVMEQAGIRNLASGDSDFGVVTDSGGLLVAELPLQSDAASRTAIIETGTFFPGIA